MHRRFPRLATILTLILTLGTFAPGATAAGTIPTLTSSQVVGGAAMPASSRIFWLYMKVMVSE